MFIAAKTRNKLWYIHTMEYGPAIKNEQTGNANNLGKSLWNQAEGKEPILQGYILYDSI